ncbi:glycoside hydrolase family 16 protein [Hypholoma sublateritium FD-334 SS-4]|uniref:Glycoside hydrolase family 16 protein n=1 Tax=Hypholoma sublateritium (strain FD-334 SS-4) TaxID=945553 RepID=A0A0D2M466_HYPSF|nr:glycoside hydrolase family 16 protein [Hypholoma sublateritium FD-334 SS-4]
MFPASLLPLAFLLPFAAVPVTADTYDMVMEYAGQNFFDDWTFYNNFDNLTNGDVVFLSASEALSSRLAFVDTTTNNAIMQVDNSSTVVYNDKRNSVRLQTNVRYGVGSVWIADMLHVPYGCSVWPAWWSNAPDWPTGGEIDTFEGVNMVTNSQMGLHTLAGCTVTGQNQSSTLLNSTDCSYLDNSNQGCITTDPDPASYGAAFAAAGGGVFVTEFATTGISVWFFSRADVPAAITANSSSIDTSTLGVPVGNWPSTSCSSSEFFEPQNLIFDITLCGDFAGATTVFAETCSGVCYNDFVLGNGSNYDTAYFEVASVRVFSKEGTNTIVQASAAPRTVPAAALGVALSTLAVAAVAALL